MFLLDAAAEASKSGDSGQTTHPSAMHILLSPYNVYHCDEYINSNGNCVTYCNHSLKHSSFLDHVIVSNAVRQDIVSAEVHDTGSNLSDHIPIIYTFRWSLSCNIKQSAAPTKVKQYSWRWDKSNLDLYYQCTNHNLNSVNIPAALNCGTSCNVSSHLDAINMYYENTVAALHSAASTAIPRIPCNTLKPFWNEELDRLKNDSIFWHNLWIDAGKPSSGVVQQTRLACKAKYKLAIRNAYALFENKLSDEMYSHYINKRIPEFWETWNAKFRKKH